MVLIGGLEGGRSIAGDEKGGGGVRWRKEKWAVGALSVRKQVHSNAGITPCRTAATVAVETARSVGCEV